MQYGSYPVVAPQNETFPADFNLHRTGLQPIHLAPNNNSRLLKMSSPIPGSWFTIAFINDYLEDSISQKVCSYYSQCCPQELAAAVVLRRL